MTRKNMYLAMKNLSEYIAASPSSNFDDIWKAWMPKYNPDGSIIPGLKKMGQQLCKLNKEDIKSVPEMAYRKKVKQMMEPEIEHGGES